MHGAKVAVVVASVFNTLNTIDCRVGVAGGLLKDAGITTGQRSEVSPGEEVDLHPGLGEVWILAARLLFYVFSINMKQIYRRTESKSWTCCFKGSNSSL